MRKPFPFGRKTGDFPLRKASDEQLASLDQVNSHGLLSNVFDDGVLDMEHIEHTIQVHGSI